MTLREAKALRPGALLCTADGVFGVVINRGKTGGREWITISTRGGFRMPGWVTDDRWVPLDGEIPWKRIKRIA